MKKKKKLRVIKDAFNVYYYNPNIDKGVWNNFSSVYYNPDTYKKDSK